MLVVFFVFKNHFSEYKLGLSLIYNSFQWFFKKDIKNY